MSTAIGEYGNSSSMHVFRSHLTRSPGLCCKALVVIAGALLTTAPHQLDGATINARSPALADVATAIALERFYECREIPERFGVNLLHLRKLQDQRRKSLRGSLLQNLTDAFLRFLDA